MVVFLFGLSFKNLCKRKRQSIWAVFCFLNRSTDLSNMTERTVHNDFVIIVEDAVKRGIRVAEEEGSKYENPMMIKRLATAEAKGAFESRMDYLRGYQLEHVSSSLISLLDYNNERKSDEGDKVLQELRTAITPVRKKIVRNAADAFIDAAFNHGFNKVSQNV